MAFHIPYSVVTNVAQYNKILMSLLVLNYDDAYDYHEHQNTK